MLDLRNLIHRDGQYPVGHGKRVDADGLAERSGVVRIGEVLDRAVVGRGMPGQAGARKQRVPCSVAAGTGIQAEPVELVIKCQLVVRQIRTEQKFARSQL